MPLMAVSLLASCNNGGGDKPGEVKFSISSDQPISVDGKVATVYVDWTPNDIIKFESFTFDATPTKGNTVTFDPTGDPRPMPVTITFENDITEDISGTLSFKYEDVTAKTKGESSINVTIPKPEVDPTLTKEEFDNAVSFKDVQYLQVDEAYIIDPSMPSNFVSSEFSPTVSHYLISGGFKDEGYTRKNPTEPVTYDLCFREVAPENFTFWYDVDESYFGKPQTFTIGTYGMTILEKIEDLLGAEYYSSFSYVKGEGVYKAEATKGTITLKFEDKKLVGFNFDLVDEEYCDTTGTLTYLEETPDFPVDPGL